MDWLPASAPCFAPIPQHDVAWGAEPFPQQPHIECDEIWLTIRSPEWWKPFKHVLATPLPEKRSKTPTITARQDDSLFRAERTSSNMTNTIVRDSDLVKERAKACFSREGV